MIALIIIMMSIALFAIVVGAILIQDNSDAALPAFILIVVGIGLITASLMTMEAHSREQTTIAVKETVLKNLTYTNHTTLVPKGSEFYYVLNDSSMHYLFNYLTTEEK
jgi:Na+/phosphate symporter